MKRFIPICLLLLSWLVTAAVYGETGKAKPAEILHWWTSDSEKYAVQLLQQVSKEKGTHWQEFAVAGSGGESAMRVLRSRVLAGTPPSAVQIKAPNIADWQKLGFLKDLSALSSEQGWSQVLPAAVQQFLTYNGKLSAVPVNIHRENWLWVNRRLLIKLGLVAPASYDELIALADELKQQGLTPLAHGNTPWQNLILFDAIALGRLGKEAYLQAFVKLDNKAIRSEAMLDSFARLRSLQAYMGENVENKDWHEVTQQVIQGKAAMQLAGDWAKPEFMAAGLKPGKDFVCVAAPDTQRLFSYNVDSFILFKLNPATFDQLAQDAQLKFADVILDRRFQEEFNLRKGSLPVRTDIPLDNFDSCARQASRDFHAAEQQGNLLPSLSQGNATSNQLYLSIQNVVDHFFNNKEVTPQQAVSQLEAAIKSQGY